MKKLLIFGGSIVTENYYNTRLHGSDEVDPYNFSYICGRLGGYDSVKTVALNAAGNQWTSAAVINALDTMDSSTDVIVQWAPADRWDMFVSDRANEVLEFPGTRHHDLFPAHLSQDPVFNNTHDLEGKPTDTGYRAWITGSMYMGAKHSYAIKYYDTPDSIRSSYESIALVQRLLKERGIKQRHMLPWNIEQFRERPVMKYLRSAHTADKVNYVPISFRHLREQMSKKYPFLEKWHKLIDMDLCTENHVDFFEDRQLPFWCGHMVYGLHQLPFNNYLLAKSQFFPESTVDFLDEVIKETKEHCLANGINYDFDCEAVQLAIQTCKNK